MQAPGDGDIPVAGLVCTLRAHGRRPEGIFFIIILQPRTWLPKEGEDPGVSTSVVWLSRHVLDYNETHFFFNVIFLIFLGHFDSLPSTRGHIIRAAGGETV